MFTGKPLCFLSLEKLFCVNESSQSIDFSQFLKNSTAEILAPFSNITAAQANLVLVPKVVSVTSPNAKTLVVTFNKAMDKDTLLNDQGTAATNDNRLLTTAVAITELDGQTPITEGSAVVVKIVGSFN